MSFWRKEVIQPALDQETRRHMEEQIAWIGRDPTNPRPYCNLARLYRMENRQDEALGLLLEAVRLNEKFGAAHVALAEIYAVREDYRAAWRHGRAAAENGNPEAIELLQRHKIPDY